MTTRRATTTSLLSTLRLVVVAACTMVAVCRADEEQNGGVFPASSRVCPLCLDTSPPPHPEKNLTTLGMALPIGNDGQISSRTCGELASSLMETPLSTAECNTVQDVLGVKRCDCPQTCLLCIVSGWEPQDAQAHVRVPSTGHVLTCRELEALAPTATTTESCAFFQQAGASICQCAPPDPPQQPFVDPTCTLCPSGEALPHPQRTIFGDATCQALERQAQNDFESNCPAWQATAGFYCGCEQDDSRTDEEFCSLCGAASDTLTRLPRPSQVLTLQDGSKRSCGELEIQVNTFGNFDCSQFQDYYGSACGCNDSSDKNNNDKTLANNPSTRSSTSSAAGVLTTTNTLLMTMVIATMTMMLY